MHDNNSGSIINKLLGKYPGRTLHRLGAALGGLWITSLMINLIWPLPDQAVTNDSLVGIKMKRENLPRIPINLLLIGVSNLQSGLSKEGNVNRDSKILSSISLMKLSHNEPLQIIEIPTQLEMILPGSKDLSNLSQIYSKGGVSISAEFVSKLLRLPKDKLKSYLILNDKTLSRLIDGIGGITISLNRSVGIKGKGEAQSFFLPAAVQSLDGYQVSKLLLYLSDNSNKAEIKMIKSSILKGIWEELRSPQSTQNILNLSKDLINTAQTNLSHRELINLIAAIGDSNYQPILEEVSSSFFSE